VHGSTNGRIYPHTTARSLKRANCDDDTVAYDLLVPERDQLSLLPPSMVDWLPEDHLTCFVLDAVEEMDLSPFQGEFKVPDVASWPGSS